MPSAFVAERKMQKEELFAFAAALGGAVIDYPFQDDFETAVFRHADTRRWFGIWLSVPCRWFGAENAGRGSAGLFGAEITGVKTRAGAVQTQKIQARRSA